MAEWLSVAGLSLLIITTTALVRQAIFRGDSPLLFLLPLAGFGQVQKSWEHYGVLALLRVLGGAALLVGVALFYLQQTNWMSKQTTLGQVLHGAKTPVATTFVHSPEAALLMLQGEGKRLSGSIHGQALMAPVQVTLLNGVLNIQQGHALLADLSISVLLGWRAQEIQQRRTLLVTPTDANGPTIHVSWTPEGQDYAQTRVFTEGYRLQLALAPLGDHQFTGTLELILPDTLKSYLVGDFKVRANRLRYRDGNVDLFFDHPDTLAFVARDYLKAQLPTGAVTSIRVEKVKLRRAVGKGEVYTHVLLEDGTLEQHHLELQEGAAGWAVIPGSMDVRVLRSGTVDALAASGGATSVPPDPYDPITNLRIRDFSALAPYIDQPVDVVQKDGSEKRGTLIRIEPQELGLEIAIGAGRAEINLPMERVRALRLADGTLLRLEADGVNGTATTAAAGSPVKEADQQSNSNLIGRSVTVTLKNGDRHTGLLEEVNDGRLTLAVVIGSGRMAYFFNLEDVVSIEEKQ